MLRFLAGCCKRQLSDCFVVLLFFIGTYLQQLFVLNSDVYKTFSSRRRHFYLQTKMETKTLLNALLIIAVQCHVVNTPLGLGYVSRNFNA